MSLILDEHRQYLTDGPRLAAFETAIRQVVRHGDVVLDLGAGTGVLGFMACRAGAARVFAVDSGSIVQMGRELAAANGFSDRVTFIQEFSTRVQLPEPVDVVVCDQMGHMGFEAGVFEYVRDAQRRHLKPGGRSVPQAVRIVVAALESDDLRSRLDFWSQRPGGLDVSAGREIALNTGYPMTVPRQQLLSSAEVIAQARVLDDVRQIAGTTTVTVTRAGRLDGICAWFEGELAPGVSITNEPGAPDRIDRRNVMLPISQPLAVKAGDTVTVRLHIIPDDTMVTWDVEIRRPALQQPLLRSRHSTFQGMLIADEDLRATAPTLVPELTPGGRARQLVLELCDGRHSLREIEELVWQRHRTLLATEADAAAFVGEVVGRYCTLSAPVPSR